MRLLSDSEYQTLDIATGSRHAYRMPMATDRLMLHGSESGGKPDRRLVTPAVAQWTLVGILLVLFGLSHTGGPIGAFLRSFSTFLFP